MLRLRWAAACRSRKPHVRTHAIATGDRYEEKYVFRFGDVRHCLQKQRARVFVFFTSFFWFAVQVICICACVCVCLSVSCSMLCSACSTAFGMSTRVARTFLVHCFSPSSQHRLSIGPFIIFHNCLLCVHVSPNRSFSLWATAAAQS